MKKVLIVVGLMVALLVAIGSKGESKPKFNLGDYNTKYSKFNQNDFNPIDVRMFPVGTLNNRNLASASYAHTGNGSFINKILFPITKDNNSIKFMLVYDQDEARNHNKALSLVIDSIISGRGMDVMYEVDSIPATYTYEAVYVENSNQGDYAVQICNNKQKDCAVIGVYDAQTMLEFVK